MWLHALRREDFTPTQNSKVCNRHFLSGMAINDPNSMDYVPTLHLGHGKPTKHRTTSRSRTTCYWTVDELASCTTHTEKLELLGLAVPQSTSCVEVSTCDMQGESSFNPSEEITGRAAHMYDKSNPDWAPTLKLGGTLTRSESAKERQRSESKQNRYRRAKSRARSKEKLQGSQDLLDPGIVLDPEVWAAPVDAHEDEESVQVCNLVLQQEYEHDYAEPASQAYSKLQRLRTEQIMLKDQIHDLKFNEKSFENNNHKVTYYTGLPSFLTLMTVFDLVKSFIPAPKVNSDLGQFECFVMTLMRLKLNLPVQDLAFRFRTSTSTVSRTFLIVIHVLYTRLKNLLYWPERDVLMKTMPLKFQKHFGQKTAVIIDCFEVFIERPKNVLAHAQMWSNYKHSNTVKFLMGVTPQGSVSFLSKSWGGRASDKCIIENCGLLLKLLPGDLILADHGFNIQDSVESYCAEVNIPSFSNGKAQLSAVDEETTREVAHVRTHVERLSGLVRNKYTLLQARLPVDYLIKNDDGLPVVDKIVTVACALTNLCDSVVSLTRA